ncbi:MAG TPA: class I SAM-dependent methyltransferase [Candidatus Saccharimonadales bacterium]|jgi:2-polyprenyl-3-methyl-5-hydroxy-6-metoxy-1,4-benzoquinol methylase|nr:class I SAM-dependent methyltransferase [Candidatus Saccharimonadales bacterium]
MNRPEIHTISPSQHAAINEGETRFAFGENWQRFLQALSDERIAKAEDSLREMLGAEGLDGQSFLDIGSGSGLFSLAAMRLGAARVHSFDYDPQSVECAKELRRRYFHESTTWLVEQGNALDKDYLAQLGQFDVVYSWGVLHHTGDMWQALANVTTSVGEGGKLFIALYNDQGLRSRLWREIKVRYNRSQGWRWLLTAFFTGYFATRAMVADVARLRNPMQRYRQYKQSRGMSYFTDLLDWIGGYPFEVAKPETVCEFFRTRGFELVRLKAVRRGWGNNEFVFARRAGPRRP